MTSENATADTKIAFANAATAAPHGRTAPVVRLFRAVRRAVLAIQEARMRSVLCQFSDRRLAEIGLERDEIEAYARSLVAGDVARR